MTGFFDTRKFCNVLQIIVDVLAKSTRIGSTQKGTKTNRYQNANSLKIQKLAVLMPIRFDTPLGFPESSGPKGKVLKHRTSPPTNSKTITDKDPFESIVIFGSAKSRRKSLLDDSGDNKDQTINPACFSKQ